MGRPSGTRWAAERAAAERAAAERVTAERAAAERVTAERGTAMCPPRGTRAETVASLPRKTRRMAVTGGEARVGLAAPCWLSRSCPSRSRCYSG